MNELQGKRVVVTGAGGFIGSHLAERLVELGARVRALVHYNALGSWGWLDHSALKKEMEVVAGDIRDRDRVSNILRETDVVFHLAALIGIPYSYQSPDAYVQTNVVGTVNVLHAARDLRLSRVVHTSTSEVYGTAVRMPIDESHPLQSQSPYSASKIAADKMAEAFHRSFALPVVTVRPFNTFGPRQSARAVVPAIITQCLHGSRVCLGNLRPTRDLNFVTDTVEGFVRAAVVPAAIGQTVHLGSGREISIGDLAGVIGRLMGKSIVIESDAERMRPGPSEVERLLADTALAEGLLGWRPVVGLEEGLRRTIAWITDHADRYRPGTYAV